MKTSVHAYICTDIPVRWYASTDVLCFILKNAYGIVCCRSRMPMKPRTRFPPANARPVSLLAPSYHAKRKRERFDCQGGRFVVLLTCHVIKYYQIYCVRFYLLVKTQASAIRTQWVDSLIAWQQSRLCIFRAWSRLGLRTFYYYGKRGKDK